MWMLDVFEHHQVRALRRIRITLEKGISFACGHEGKHFLDGDDLS